MNLFGRDLKVDHTGDDVRQVPNQLVQLGVAIPDAERSKAKFGPATHDAIMNLQRENGLPPTGVVDGTTADLLALLVQATSAPATRSAIPLRRSCARRKRRPTSRCRYAVDGTLQGRVCAALQRVGVGNARHHADRDRRSAHYAGLQADLQEGKGPSDSLGILWKLRGRDTGGKS